MNGILTNCRALGVVCLWAVLLLPAGIGRCQSNLVLLASQPGDYIGGGHDYVTTNQADFTVSSPYGVGMQITAFGFYMDLSGAGGAPLAVGTYTNATRESDGSQPGLDVFGNGNGCDNTCGSFQILELGMDDLGNITDCWLTFTQYCECAAVALTGEIRYNSYLAPPAPVPRTLHVPADYPTIQAAIDEASLLTSDTILVAPGIYNESINFNGKAALLTSANGPAATVINPPGLDAAFYFVSGETAGAIVSGFTITNSGVSVSYSSPTISSNVLINCGTGVSSYFGSPNILDNSITGCSGGAVYLGGAGNAVIQGNIMENNSGGIGMNSAGSPLVANNLIENNNGDALSGINDCDVNVVQNIIANNTGNALNFLVPYGDRGPVAVNNTIVNNAYGISISGFDSASEIINNIIIGNNGVNISYFNSDAVPIFQNNDIFSAEGNPYSGVLSGLAGSNGNISSDPFFACLPNDDFHLLAGSPGIDAGTDGAPFLTALDFDGNPRILAGNTNNIPTVDMGAYEFNPLTPPVPCLYVDCQTDIVTATTAGQSSVVVYYPAPVATPTATVVCSPPPGSSFPAGTNVVTCTATYGTNSTSCSFNVIVLVPPTITQQPQNITVPAGKPFTLSVGVSGTSPLSYVWEFQGHAIDGANSATLTVSDAQAANDGVYTVAVFNQAGGIGSSLARVRVLPAKPVIVSNPASTIAPAGSGVVFNVAATGSEPLSYQWFFNRQAIHGATTAQLNLTNVQAGNAGTYQVSVANGSGVATSVAARLTVRATAPYFGLQPATTSVLSGGTVTLTSLAAGTQPIRYQWYFHGILMRNQTSPTLTIAKAGPAEAGAYTVYAINALGVAKSLPAQLIVEVPPQTVTPPASQIVQAGRNVTLKFSVNGSSPLSYTWQCNGIPLPGTNAVLTLTNIAADMTGYYQVTASNPYGSTSAVARVSVVAPASRLLAWGDNSGGQTNVPAGMTNIVGMAGGDFHTVAIRANGTLAAWGDNDEGQITIPKQLRPIALVAAGASHNLAIDLNGSLVAWGNNTSGQCVIPTAATNQPLTVAAGDAHSLALLANGTVVAWGDDTFGQTNLPDVLTPYYEYEYWYGEIFYYPNPNWVAADAIAAGRNHSLAVLVTGSVVGWGDDTYGQIDIPASLTNAVAVAGGYLHSVALCADGTVVAWGDDTYGQTDVPAGLTNVVAIAAGDFHTLALLANGTVVGWGDDSYGQIDIPVRATNAAGIAAGYYHSLALVPPVVTNKVPTVVR